MLTAGTQVAGRLLRGCREYVTWPKRRAAKSKDGLPLWALRRACGGGAVLGTAGIAISGSPIITANDSKGDTKPKMSLREPFWREKIAFISGRVWGHTTERVLENEAGQSLFMLLFIASMAYGLMYQGIVAAHVRRLQCRVASHYGCLGVPHYVNGKIPPNPLLRKK